MLKNSILSSISGKDSKQYVDDIFSVYTYTGNSTTQTINNGIDLAGKGGLVWTKSRSSAYNNELSYTALSTVYLGTQGSVRSNQTVALVASDITGYASSGFHLGIITGFGNLSGEPFVSWTFRNADKFYDHQVVTKSAGSNTTVNFANLGTLGMVRVKRTDSTGSWYVWHRSLSAGQLLIGETTAAAATLGHVTVSGTTVTLVNSVIADGTYLVEAFAHDSSADGIIQCGSFTTDGSGNASVNLGWEPQWLLVKASGATQNWWIEDSMRGLPVGGSTGPQLSPNLSVAEVSTNGTYGITAGFQQQMTSTGFFAYGSPSSTYIYLAIRRPNKPPTTGTQVYDAIARTGTGAAATSSAGFPVDLVITKKRSSTSLTGAKLIDRLRGKTNWLDSSATTIETATADTVTGLDSMTGVVFGADATTSAFNTNTHTYVDECFRRGAGFMDVVCDTGTGVAHAVSHNLTKAPELIIRKSRSAATQWEVWHSSLTTTEKLVLNSDAAKVTDSTAWNSTAPTSTQFTVGTGTNINANAATFITYLFATLAGISKVGSYTGNGSTQTIDCGFSSGARFFLVKAASTTGSWWIFDTVRGIVSSSDPALQLNSTAAEITSADAVDQYVSGIIVNQEATCSINANGVSYVYLSIS